MHNIMQNKQYNEANGYGVKEKLADKHLLHFHWQLQSITSCIRNDIYEKKLIRIYRMEVLAPL